MSKPEKYPLPWCDHVDFPYWKINLGFCFLIKGWSENKVTYQWQKSFLGLMKY